MSVLIFSKAPDGEKAVDPASKLGDVKVIVARLDAAGHQDIKVGSDEASGLPFHQWEAAASGVRLE